MRISGSKKKSDSDFFKPEEEIVICLTGLRYMSQPDVKENKGPQFVIEMLDKLISQLPPTAKIRIESFEAPIEEQYQTEDEIFYKSAVKEAVESSNFKNRINLYFRDEYLDKNTNPDAFILNFAGTEISDMDLLNNHRFIDASLYFDNAREREVALSKLNVTVNPESRILETPLYVWRGYVLDRKNCFIIDRGMENIYYIDLDQNDPDRSVKIKNVCEVLEKAKQVFTQAFLGNIEPGERKKAEETIRKHGIKQLTGYNPEIKNKLSL